MGRKKQELNYMNAVACLLVILIHVLSMGISSLEHTSWQAALVYLPWRLSAFVVPMFLYTGAIKMARQYGERVITAGDYGRYILQRFRKIYLPYVVWVVIYYLAFLPIGYVRGELGEFLSYLWLGNLSSPFYYILVVMQFYLLLPVWVWMVRQVPAYLGVSIGLLVTLLMQQSGRILDFLGLEFAYTDRIFPTYLIFWVVGLYVGKYYDRVASVLARRQGRVLCGGVILLGALAAYLQYAGAVYVLDLNNIKLVTDLLSIALLHGLCISIRHLPERLRSVLQWIYAGSFFVYLSHCVFLTLTTAYLQGRGISDLFVLLGARLLVCFTVPFVLWYVYQGLICRYPRLPRLLG